VNRRQATRGERRAFLLYVALVIALSYRPGHPWAGVAGGGVAIVVLALVLMVARPLSQLTNAKRRDRD
jgi:hypothetical protein